MAPTTDLDSIPVPWLPFDTSNQGPRQGATDRYYPPYYSRWGFVYKYRRLFHPFFSGLFLMSDPEAIAAAFVPFNGPVVRFFLPVSTHTIRRSRQLIAGSATWLFTGCFAIQLCAYYLSATRLFLIHASLERLLLCVPQ